MDNLWSFFIPLFFYSLTFSCFGGDSFRKFVAHKRIRCAVFTSTFKPIDIYQYEGQQFDTLAHNNSTKDIFNLKENDVQCTS